MKKIIIVMAVLILSVSAFCFGLTEQARAFWLDGGQGGGDIAQLGIREDSNIPMPAKSPKLPVDLKDFDARMANGIRPMAAKKTDIDSGIKSEQLKYFLQPSDKDDYVCADKSGTEGYNDITVDEFIADPQKGECANLMGAALNGVNLSMAKLSGANLKEADLRWAILSGADLSWANLEGADLKFVILNKATLNKANLKSVNLKWSSLESAKLRWANLKGADLEGASLRGADLFKAILISADLKLSNLVGVDMRWTDTNKTNLKGARYNLSTILPFNRAKAKKRGMKEVK